MAMKHDPAHPYVRRMIGCGHGVMFTDYCRDCEIVSLRQSYQHAMRQAVSARERLRAMGEADGVNLRDVRADVRAEPSLWLAISQNGRVKYTTDSARAGAWACSDEYRVVRDYYTTGARDAAVAAERDACHDLALLNGAGCGTQAEWEMVQSIARAIRARGDA